MKFTINTKPFRDAVKKVSRVIANHVADPILIGILIKAQANRLVLKGSNNDMEMLVTVPANNNSGLEVASTGQLVINSRVFKSIINTLTSQTVTISTNDKFVVGIKSGRSNIHLNGLDADNYPRFSAGLSAKTALKSVDSQVISTIIKDTLSDTGKKQSQSILTGVNFKPVNGQLVATATDAHQLASVQTGIPTSRPSHHQVTILNKGLKVLGQLISQNRDSKQVKLAYQSNLAYFQIGNYQLYVRLLEGAYPDTSGLIKDQFSTEASIKLASLIPALKQASVIAKTNSDAVIHLSFKSNAQTLEVSTDSPDVGRTVTPVHVESLSGSSIDININVDYLINALSKFDAKATVKFQLTNPLKPLVITNAHDKNRNFIQLVTPIRIN